MCDPDCQNYAMSSQDFAVVEPEAKTDRQTVDPHHHPFLKLRNYALAKRESISSECVQADWNAGIAVLDSLLRAELLKRERPSWIIDV